MRVWFVYAAVLFCGRAIAVQCDVFAKLKGIPTAKVSELRPKDILSGRDAEGNPLWVSHAYRDLDLRWEGGTLSITSTRFNEVLAFAERWRTFDDTSRDFRLDAARNKITYEQYYVVRRFAALAAKQHYLDEVKFSEAALTEARVAFQRSGAPKYLPDQGAVPTDEYRPVVEGNSRWLAAKRELAAQQDELDHVSVLIAEHLKNPKSQPGDSAEERQEQADLQMKIQAAVNELRAKKHLLFK